MILVIDHHDSFVHNLARYFTLEGWETIIRPCDSIAIEEVENIRPTAIILSPGPCSPSENGISVDLIRALGPTIPILGVCLGHQCIGAAYGAEIVRSAPMHGMASLIEHDGTGVFADLPSAFEGGRYHSLAVRSPPASALRATAWSEDGVVMGLQHEQFPVYGVQFHPESILTPQGQNIIRNFSEIVKAYQRKSVKAAA